MIFSRKLRLFVPCILILILSCQHEIILPVPSTPSGVSYLKDIAPILTQNCNYSGCHIASNYANIPLETYHDVIFHGQVIAFKPFESNLYDVIARGYMPLGAVLSAKDQQLIYDWISEGALDN
jgi:hypothetical protein